VVHSRGCPDAWHDAVKRLLLIPLLLLLLAKMSGVARYKKRDRSYTGIGWLCASFRSRKKKNFSCETACSSTFRAAPIVLFDTILL